MNSRQRMACAPRIGLVAVLSLIYSASAFAAGSAAPRALSEVVGEVVGEVIRPLMEEQKIPGMAVAVTVHGQRHVFNYGVASKESGQRVGDRTLFELGSVSKTFTATLGAWAQARGTLVFSEPASKYFPELAGSQFDSVRVLDLATYTAGGLPLQFPDGVNDARQMTAYYRNWRPTAEPGAQRLYSNPSIGLFGELAARSMREPFVSLMQKRLFPALGLSHTYIEVPANEMPNYAWGYSKADKAVRVTPGMFDAQAYGVKSTAADMLHFVEMNMEYRSRPAGPLHRAIAATHTGYYKVGDMTQGLGWEMYAWPTPLDRLLAGNSEEISLKPNEVKRIERPVQMRDERDERDERDDVLVNKTGSTNGFGAYVAYVPSKRIGIVMLANRNYPNAERVKAAHRVLSAMAAMP
ncbi:beta-lactamase class C [Variovorax paradoxus]